MPVPEEGDLPSPESDEAEPGSGIQRKNAVYIDTEDGGYVTELPYKGRFVARGDAQSSSDMPPASEFATLQAEMEAMGDESVGSFAEQEDDFAQGEEYRESEGEPSDTSSTKKSTFDGPTPTIVSDYVPEPDFITAEGAALREQKRIEWTVHLKSVFDQMTLRLDKFSGAVRKKYVTESKYGRTHNSITNSLLPGLNRKLTSLLLKRSMKPCVLSWVSTTTCPTGR